MLGNLKDFLTVVQDGFSTNNNLRQTLKEVKKVKNLFKDKQKDVSSEPKVNYGVGGELLTKYQEQWAELHENADQNAKAAEEIDKLIIELHGVTEKKLQSACELAQNLSQIPNLTASIAQCIDSLKNVQSLMTSVEEELVEFEDIVENYKMERWKMDHHYHLTLYKEKKMVALEDIRCKLAKENTVQSCEEERRHLADLQSRQEQSAMAFRQDIAKYLSSGTVPAKLAEKPSLTLEQVQLEDDSTALDKFLDS